MPGTTHIDEVERLLGHDLPDGDYETIAGLVITELQRLPEPGDTVTVDAAHGRRVRRRTSPAPAHRRRPRRSTGDVPGAVCRSTVHEHAEVAAVSGLSTVDRRW